MLSYAVVHCWFTTLTVIPPLLTGTCAPLHRQYGTMGIVTNTPEIEVVSDPRVLLRVATLSAIFAAVVASLALAVDVAISGWGGWGSVSIGLVIGLVLLVARTITMPWWWFKAGRTRYVVSDGVLTMWNGDRLLDEVRCEDIFYIEHLGQIDTRAVFLNGFGVIDFPRAVFKGSRDVAGPPLLLWEDADPSLFQLAVLVRKHREDRKGRLAP